MSILKFVKGKRKETAKKIDTEFNSYAISDLSRLDTIAISVIGIMRTMDKYIGDHLE